jgi:hypothetical protein
MATIYKYVMPTPGGSEVHQMPAGAVPLSVQMQDGRVCLWAQVEPEVESIEARFHTIGTGWDIPEKASHLGTVQAGGFVWHVYREFA